MKVNFVLPKPVFGISGGYKVVYDYANMLTVRGDDVVIYYSLWGQNNRNIPRFIYYIIEDFIRFVEPRWFKVYCEKKLLFDFEDRYIRNADVIVATAAITADGVNKFSEAKGTKFYLIQDIEFWEGKDLVIDSYKLEMKNIAISKYIKSVVDNYSETPAFYVPNGIDLTEMYVQNKIEDRKQYSVCMYYDPNERKGVKYRIEAIISLKKQLPDMYVTCFGSDDRPDVLPTWVDYICRANRDEVRWIYNDHAIYINSTIEEGFGLTGLESMACGCCLVTSEYEAVKEYAVDKHNCLMSSVKNVGGLV